MALVKLCCSPFIIPKFVLKSLILLKCHHVMQISSLLKNKCLGCISAQIRLPCSRAITSLSKLPKFIYGHAVEPSDLSHLIQFHERVYLYDRFSFNP